MRQARGQAAVESVLVAVVVAVCGLGVVVAARAASPDPSRALTAAATAAGPVGAIGSDLALDGLPTVAGARVAAIAERLVPLDITETSAAGAIWIPRFTDGNTEAWCADFASWVLRHAGHPVSGGSSGGWRIAGAAALRDWFAMRGRYAPRSVARPIPGDIVYFNHSHIGIVVAVRGDVLETIEGNSSDAVRRRIYAGWRSIADIDGFGRPGT